MKVISIIDGKLPAVSRNINVWSLPENQINFIDSARMISGCVALAPDNDEIGRNKSQGSYNCSIMHSVVKSQTHMW